MQACYQTRLLGVVGVDGGSEFDMSDVRVGTVHLGRLGLATLSEVPQLHSTRAFRSPADGATSLAAKCTLLVSSEVNSRCPAAFSAPFMGTRT